MSAFGGASLFNSVCSGSLSLLSTTRSLDGKVSGNGNRFGFAQYKILLYTSKRRQ